MSRLVTGDRNSKMSWKEQHDIITDYTNLVRSCYPAYVLHAYDGKWIPSRAGMYVAQAVDDFIEADTGHSFDILVISLPPQHGKLIADYTPVLTKGGWKTHGELEVGDYVVSPSGEYVKVTNVHPKHYANKRVHFTDGSFIDCHEKHEWVLYDRYSRKERTIETREIEKCYEYGGKLRVRGHRYRYLLPIRKALVGDYKELSVEPYVLGAWLGDGTTRKNCICACPNDSIVLDECAKYYEVSSANVHKDTGVITKYFRGLRQDLKEYGLCYNEKTVDKFIPSEYLTASYEQRMELLAGLIDTDGYVDLKHHRVVFTTCVEGLRDSFEDLIATFGWRTTTCTFKPTTSSSGICGKKEYWQIAFNPTSYIPCRIPRKQLKTFSKQRRVSICSIENIEHINGNCITVEGGVYCVGRKMHPTHNSMTVTETLPSYFLGRFPDKRVIEISYSEDFAKLFGRRNKSKIEQFGERLFGIKLATKPNSATEFEIDGHTGGMISRGVLSGVTGRPADLMIIDDPIKTSQEAQSATYRNRVWDEWNTSFKSRLSAGAKVIVIQTRWHEDDLVGRIIANEDNVTIVNLPCEAEINDPLGRMEGEALAPEIGKDDDWLMSFKQGYMTQAGKMAWNALYQGRPSAMEGNLIKREWWKYYEELPDCPTWAMSVDATFKDKEDNDFVAIQVWAKLGVNMYLVDLIKAHLDFIGTVSAIRSMRNKYPRVSMVLIEDKANGSAIITVLRQTMQGIIPVNPIGGKVARANAVTPCIEAGNVWLPKYATFTEDFVDECGKFPNAAHDDQVDAMTQMLTRFMSFKADEPKKPTPIGAFKDLFAPKRNPIGKGEKIDVI